MSMSLHRIPRISLRDMEGGGGGRDVRQVMQFHPVDAVNGGFKKKG